jgi:hypothetical protein
MVDKGCGFNADACVTLARAGRLEELKVKHGQFDCRIGQICAARF